MMLETLDDIWMHFLRVSDTSCELVIALCVLLLSWFFFFFFSMFPSIASNCNGQPKAYTRAPSYATTALLTALPTIVFDVA